MILFEKKLGFTGNQCQTPVPPAVTCFGIPQTNSSVCSGNGICVSQDNCTCNRFTKFIFFSLYHIFLIFFSYKSSNSGWTGSQCNIPVVIPVTTCFGVSSTNPLVCSGHGQCIATGFFFRNFHILFQNY